MSVSIEYIKNLVVELNADKEERDALALPEPVAIAYGVGFSYEPCHRYFSSIIDAEMYLDACGADYIDEIKIY
jgi:hypothetical protein